jgi:hypothetical protein
LVERFNCCDDAKFFGVLRCAQNDSKGRQRQFKCKDDGCGWGFFAALRMTAKTCNGEFGRLGGTAEQELGGTAGQEMIDQ